MPDVVTVEPAPASEPAEPAPASEPAAEPAEPAPASEPAAEPADDDSDEEAPSPSQSFKRTTSAMTEPIPEEVMRMRGSIQAPSYEEWSEAKKLAEGEDSDDVAVDEGRDVVGRPPASRRDWRRSSEMENYGNIEEKLKERAAQQAAMENARTGRSGRNVVADAAKESPPKGKGKKEVKSSLGGLFTKLAAEQADPSSVEPQGHADADPANRGSTGSEVEGLDAESVMSKLSSGDALERMRRSSSRRNFNDHDGQTGNRGLVNLKMRNCCLDDACFQFIAKGLRSTKSQAITHIDIGKNKMGAKGCDYIHETLQKRRNLTQRLRIVAKDQTGIKDLLIKDMIEDWWKKNEQERMNSKMTSAAESSMSSAD